ncbi:MAG: hypothetical protein GX220_02870 [Treponema sp.]|nr:hypothetical protein [Treponema sp.]
MAQHPIRKFFGLALLYVIIIFGIFALQFRNRAVISKNFGSMRLTVSHNKATDAKLPYTNGFQVSFNGITFFSDKNDHIEITHSNGKIQDLIFLNWHQISENSIELFFSEDISLIFESTDKENPSYSVFAKLNSQSSKLSIPYSYSGSFSITDLSEKRAILQSKNLQTMLAGPKISANRIYFMPKQLSATYSSYNPVEAFSFASLAPLRADQNELFNAVVKQTKNNILNAFTPFPDSADEIAVTAYIAEMALQGKYIEAINNIPQSFKNGTRRTYLTAPQLNNLAAMNSSYIMYNENMIYKINHALSTHSLDIFEDDNISPFIERQKTEVAHSILNLPNAVLQNNPNYKFSLEKAIGILYTYCKIYKKSPNLANKLTPILPNCLTTIEKSCSMQDEILVIQQDNTAIYITNAIKAAVALINYGEISKNSTYISAGKMLATSHLQLEKQPDLTTLSNIYTLLCESNYIPHQIVLKPKGNTIHAWTIAQDVSTSVDSEGTITIVSTFPRGANHHMIINGIEPFSSIEIYGIQFRTDPRFETYNSSGYVYDAKTKTLLLKQRHKETKEIVRLFYKTQPVVPEPKTENQSSEVNTNEKQINPVSENENSSVSSNLTDDAEFSETSN